MTKKDKIIAIETKGEHLDPTETVLKEGSVNPYDKQDL